MRKYMGLVVVIILLCGVVSTGYGRENLSEDEKLGKGWVVSNVSEGSDDTMVILDVKALIEATPEKIWALLTDINHWSSWMPVVRRSFAVNNVASEPEKVKEVYDEYSSGQPVDINIDNNGKTVVNTFEEYDFPWPVSNDWLLGKYVFDATGSAEGLYKASWRQLLEGTEGSGGSWVISKYENGDSLFTYHLSVKRKAGIPKGPFKIIIENSVERLIGAIRKSVVGGIGAELLDKPESMAVRPWWDKFYKPLEKFE